MKMSLKNRISDRMKWKGRAYQVRKWHEKEVPVTRVLKRAKTTQTRTDKMIARGWNDNSWKSHPHVRTTGEGIQSIVTHRKASWHGVVGIQWRCILYIYKINWREYMQSGMTRSTRSISIHIFLKADVKARTTSRSSEKSEGLFQSSLKMKSLSSFARGFIPEEMFLKTSRVHIRKNNRRVSIRLNTDATRWEFSRQSFVLYIII